MQLTLRGVRLVDAEGDRRDIDIAIGSPQIRAIGRLRGGKQHAIEAPDAIITPGFIDVHTHGGGGFSLHTTDPDEILAYAHWAPATGTTAFLVAVVGVEDALPMRQIEAAVAAIPASTLGAERLGIFMEGPYISLARRGAHAVSWLRTPHVAETERILSLAGGHLRLVTLAPELPGAFEMIQQLHEAGVTVSIGHSDASYDQTREAIQLGVTHATHCFNAMRPLQHRDPGPIGAIVEAGQVFGEIISDGVHVHPAAVRVLLRALGPERTIVITDAQTAAGVPDANFEFAGQPAHVVDGAARLADGTLAGSVLTMDQALRNVVALEEVPLHQAVAMLTLNPARAAGVAHRKGRLQPGYDADLLIFDESLTLQATLCGGEVAYATEEWRARLEGD
jgi:N-acetylglucosamine-6-phosphate deacetylase